MRRPQGRLMAARLPPSDLDSAGLGGPAEGQIGMTGKDRK